MFVSRNVNESKSNRQYKLKKKIKIQNLIHPYYGIKTGRIIIIIIIIIITSVERDSVVGIAMSYGLEGPGIESRCEEIFRNHPDGPLGLPILLQNG